MWPEKKIQFPVGLLAQLVECYTGIAEVMHSIPVYNRSQRIEDRFYIRISIIVIISMRFFRLFIHLFFSQSAKQPVSKTPLTFFRKAEEIGITISVFAPTRKVIQSPQKLKKNGSLSIVRFKSVVLGMLERGTLVQRRKAGFGLG